MVMAGGTKSEEVAFQQRSDTMTPIAIALNADGILKWAKFINTNTGE